MQEQFKDQSSEPFQERTRLIGIFIDDERPLTVPTQLRDKDIEWHIFRSIREMRRSAIFNTDPVDYICFDYYLTGSETGMDALTVMMFEYRAEGWPLPAANFHSSDPSCNEKMALEWYNAGGKFVCKDTYTRISTKQTIKNSQTVNQILDNMPALTRTTRVLGKDKAQKRKGLKRKGGRP